MIGEGDTMTNDTLQEEISMIKPIGFEVLTIGNKILRNLSQEVSLEAINEGILKILLRIWVILLIKQMESVLLLLK